MGITFVATPVGGTQAYEYSIGLQGAITSSAFNTRIPAATTYYQDLDSDGFGNPTVSIITGTLPVGYVSNSDDCDDTDADVNPGATEIEDGIDNNCDGTIDEGFGNNVPTADAGADQNVQPTATVTLDSSGSSANDAAQTLTYAWTQTVGTAVTLSSTTAASPTFTAPNLVIGDSDTLLRFSLIVDDGIDPSVADTVDITVVAPTNAFPTANAGSSQSVASGAGVTLDGTASSANDGGQTLTYTWTQTNGTAVTLSSTTAASPTFTAPTLSVGDLDELLTFSLTVNDGFDTSSASTVEITVNAPGNTAPSANAGSDDSVASGAGVTLDGTGSSANDAGQTLEYNWTQISGTSVTLSSTSAASPTFTAPTLSIGDSDELLTFSLTVFDGIESSGPDTVEVIVIAPLDTEAPVIRPIGDVSFEAGPGGTRTIGFSAIVDDNVDTGIVPVFRLDGDVISSPHAFPIGENVITINASDTAGNAAAEVRFTITITPGAGPDVPLITTADINANRSMTIGGTAEADSTVRVTFPDSSFQDVTATGGAYSVTSAADMIGGTVSVTATDELGNASAPATVSLFPDYDAPTVTVTGAPASVANTAPFTVTITFSEPVTGFVEGDISVVGGSVTGFAGTGAVYTAAITPVAGEALSISVPGGVAEDEFSNLNLASDAVSVANIALTETQQMITRAAQSRNASLIRVQPRFSRFLLGEQTGSFNANVTRGQGNFDFATSSDRPVWSAGQGQWSTLGEMETAYANLAFGGHVEVSENVLLGLMAQVDKSVSDEGDARLESTGWLFGPYAVARLADQPLVFSGSYLKGQSDNTISPLGTYVDSYGSERTMATLGVAGEVELTRLTLIPVLDFAHVTDESEAYVDGDSNPVGATKSTTRQVTLGLDFVMPIDTARGSLDLIGGIGATSAMNDDGVESTETTRGQTELGFRYGMENGGRLTARATYDGLGQDDYEAFGAEVTFEISF